MKKMIRDRSIFTVIACIALAASVLLTAVHITPVQMAEDVRGMVTPEAETSFNTFFEEIQVWYQETPSTSEGVVVTAQGNYTRLMDTILKLEPYIMACESAAMEDETLVDRLVEYNTPLTTLLMVALNLTMAVNSAGSYTFTAEEWTELGGIIDEVVAFYQG